MLSDDQLQAIRNLVAKYEALSDRERRRYNEANTRKDFIEPLFEALGWDVRNKHEVDAEKAVKPGFADYAFLLNGLVQFYVEAKPLEDDIYNEAYGRQVITYAYSKGDTWAVLCNFKGLQVFNAQWDTPNPDRARVLNLTWDQYCAADSPVFLLSRQALQEGSLEKHAQTFGTMRPRIPVEKGLYRHMHRWREKLVRHFFRMDQDVSLEQADEAAERVIARLIFIRSSEDRHIEAYRLRAALHQWRQSGATMGLTEELANVFAEYDRTFDSDLFAHHISDQLLEKYAADTQVQVIVADMLAELHAPPNSSADYNFSVIDSDVLGRVYEQYLGHVPQVVKEEADRAKRQLSLGLQVETVGLESKRQRRKERGIYYTPKWIVDYIVSQTVARFLTEHSHHDILNIKILDPACGSGSFLIRAFDTLLEYHAGVMAKKASDLGQYERLRILTANIFGVDLDAQAVDIARLNLLLRAVAKRELLPPLADNIQLGNSLIEGTEAELHPYFGDAWEDKRPFNWEQEFREIIEHGGFDIIIGNPPYIRLHNIPDAERDYFFQRFHTAKNKCDVYGFFIERCAALLQEGGRLGFIVPNTWCSLDSFEPLRAFIMRTFVIEEISSLENPFHESTVSPAVLVLRKTSVADTRARHVIVHKEFGLPLGPAMRQTLRAATEIPQDRLASSPRQLVNLSWTPQYNRLAERIASVSISLADVCILNFGIKTGDDSNFLVPKKSSEDDKPVLRGRNIHRYWFVWDGEYVRYLPDEMKKKPIARPGDRERFEAPEKIILQGRSGRELTAAYDTGGYYTLGTTHLVRPRRPEFPLKYILGLINSKLMTFWYGSQFITSTQSENELASLPIRDLTSLSGKETGIPARIIRLTERMLDLHQRLAAKGDVHDSEREVIEREIAQTDRQIDDLVYDLYGLTAKERALIESEVRR